MDNKTPNPLKEFIAELMDSLSPEELKEFTAISTELSRLLNEYNALADAEHQERAAAEPINPLETAGITTTVNINGRNAETLTAIFNKLNEIMHCRTRLFAFKWRNCPQEIYPEAIKILKGIDAASFEQSLAERYPEGLRKNFKSIQPNYASFFDYIALNLTPHLQALAFYGLTDIQKRLINRICERAAEFYEPMPNIKDMSIAIENIAAPNIQTTRPDFYISLNDAVNNAAFNPVRQEKISNNGALKATESGQYYFADIGVQTGSKKVDTFLSIYYDDNITFTKGSKTIFLNDYDKAVFNAIVTLIETQNTKDTAFTLPMLYGVMTGRAASEVRLTPPIKKKLERTLNKLKSTEVKVKLDNPITCINDNGEIMELPEFKENIITIGEMPAYINNNFAEQVYIIRLTPYLLTYSRSKGGLRSIPIKALELGINVKNTPEVIGLRQFLINEITRINSPKQSNHITYEAIYSRAEYLTDATEPPTAKAREKARAQTRKNVNEILTSFAKEGYIAAFKEVRQGKAWHHIEITPAPKN